MIPPDAQPAMSNALGSTAAEVKGSDHATFRSRGALLSEPLEAVRNLSPCDSQLTTSLPRRPRIALMLLCHTQLVGRRTRGSRAKTGRVGTWLVPTATAAFIREDAP